MRYRNIGIGLSVTCLLACGGGGSSSQNTGVAAPGEFNVTSNSLAPEVPNSNDTSGKPICEDEEHSRLNRYLLENNDWNKGSITDYSECMTMFAGASGSVSPTWTWQWPVTVGDSTVHSYPELIFGQKPWFSSSTTSTLPAVVNTLHSVVAQFGAQLQHSNDGGGDFTFDIWLTNSATVPAQKSYLPLNTELMILLDEWGSYAPIGSKLGTSNIDGQMWNVYEMTATWGPEPWQLVMYEPQQIPSSPYKVDVHLFLQDLLSRQLISGKEWLASVEIGNEVIGGSGTNQLQNYSLVVQ